MSKPYDIGDSLESEDGFYRYHAERVEAANGPEQDDLATVHPIRRELRECFTPWTQDPIRLARLWRWLGLANEQPRDPALYMEHPEDFAEQYAALCEFEDNVA